MLSPDFPSFTGCRSQCNEARKGNKRYKDWEESFHYSQTSILYMEKIPKIHIMRKIKK